MNALAKSLNLLIGVLEREEQRTRAGEDSDPEQFATDLLRATKQLAKGPGAKAKLLDCCQELERPFAPGSEFARLSAVLHGELMGLTIRCRPKGMSNTDATAALKLWREAISGKHVVCFEDDPMRASTDVGEAFEGWRLPEKTSQARNELERELSNIATDDPYVPRSGVRGLFVLALTPRPTLRHFKQMLEDEEAPTVQELLAGARWLASWVNASPENGEPPKPVERQAETLEGGGDAGGGRDEANGKPAKSEAIATRVRVPALSEKQYLILETMKELVALSADTRRSAEDIAVACDGKQADVNVFKPLLSDLTKNHKLTESKTGRGGGSWLSDSGVEVANRLVENRKASVPKR